MPMKFGPVDINDAEGAILAHSALTPDGRIKKGRRLTASDITSLGKADLTSLIVAVLDESDVIEDEAAALVAALAAGANVRVAKAFTGRANIYAAADGVLSVDRDRLIALNRIDESLTVATLAPFSRVAAGQMIATVKIITFTLDHAVLAAARGMVDAGAHASGPLISVAKFQSHRVGLIITALPDTKPSVLEKRITAIRSRVEGMGSCVLSPKIIPHRREAVELALNKVLAAGADLLLIFGASAIVDREDVIPGGLSDAGGAVVHLGMPVDPGNLIMLGRHGNTPVIGVPSCASSPKTNGFDWVLERTLSGLDVTADDITAMAPGGLLMEIATRPQPRARAGHASVESGDSCRAPKISAVVLAAGRSTRMGAANKLLESLHGKALVRHVAEAALQSSAKDVVVVTGHEEDRVRAVLADLPLRFVINPAFTDGLATSLATGIAAVGEDFDGAIVLLGDMPFITADLIDQLIAAFSPADGRSICVPYRNGRRGNPVLWAAAFFPELKALSGDTGARHIVAANPDALAEVNVENDAIFVDIDTPEALAVLRVGDRD